MEVGLIQKILVGKEVSAFQSKKDDKAAVAFAIKTGTTTLELSALSYNDWRNWVDGLRALLRQPMEVAETKSEIEALVAIDVELSLLSQPPIPPPPENLAFMTNDVTEP
eukprot:TRINITY_DN1689_c0_g1_i2.p1 TRINITY_DN1689_c0_g1~~TRINITY_DN1689_c0_g1_i2.p1  ORF type:complete len:109 (+),score=20.21 TRINITY_DN1689_c0_g1_i2:410-736(+)